MKKTKIFIVASIALLFGAYACKDAFLEVPATGSLDRAQLTTQAGLEGTLIGAYAQLSGLGNYYAGPSNWNVGSIRGGDANKGTDPGDGTEYIPMQRYEYTPTDQVARENYKGNFEGVARANGVLTLLKDAQPSVKAEEIARMTAEARFLRGHFYFQLKRNFDKVPYVDEASNINTILKVKNDVDIWPKIEADFKAAYDALPEVANAAGRATKWAAGA